MTAYEIPLSPNPQRLTIALAGTTYQLRFFFAATDEGGWCMDIADASGAPLACGIPLVTGADLLGQYAYLGIAGKLFVVGDTDRDAVPGYADLGVTRHLIFVPT